MLLTLDMILQWTKILEITVADKAEEEGLLGGDLVLVTEVVRDVPSVLLELEHHGAGVVETGAPDRVPSVPRPPPTMVTGWSTNAHALSVALQVMATALGTQQRTAIIILTPPHNIKIIIANSSLPSKSWPPPWAHSNKQLLLF